MRDEGWGVGQLFETNSSLKCQTSLLPNPQGGGGGGYENEDLENEDLRPKTRSLFSYYENEDPVKRKTKTPVFVFVLQKRRPGKTENRRNYKFNTH